MDIHALDRGDCCLDPANDPAILLGELALDYLALSMIAGIDAYRGRVRLRIRCNRSRRYWPHAAAAAYTVAANGKIVRTSS